MRALKPGARMVFISVWPVLKSLPQIGTRISRASVDERRNVARQVGRAVGVGDPRCDRRVGVHHARRDVGVVLLQTLFERLDGLVDGLGFDVDFRTPAPDHHESVDLFFFPEFLDVGLELFGHLPPVRALLDVGAVELLDVALVEDGRHGLDLLELALDLVEERALEHAGVAGGLVAVVVEDVPAAEFDIVDRGEVDEVPDHRHAVFGALAQADGTHLGQRPDRLGDAGADRYDSGDERGGDGAHTGHQHAQFSLGGFDFDPGVGHDSRPPCGLVCEIDSLVDPKYP